MSGNFKIRVVENTGNESNSLFGTVGSVFDIVNGKLEDKEGFCWDRGGEGFKDIFQVNEKFDGGAWGTVFELVGHTKNEKIFEKGVEYKFSRKNYCKWYFNRYGLRYSGDRDWVEELCDTGVFIGNGGRTVELRTWLVDRPWCKKVNGKAPLTLDQYQELCTRTVNSEQSHKDEIVNYSLGMVCEAAEVGDEVKKQMFHGHKLDSAKIKDELGDTLWYISNLARKYGLTLSEVAEHNVEKLKQRYPDGFREQDSINRRKRNERDTF